MIILINFEDLQRLVENMRRKIVITQAHLIRYKETTTRIIIIRRRNNRNI